MKVWRINPSFFTSAVDWVTVLKSTLRSLYVRGEICHYQLYRWLGELQARFGLYSREHPLVPAGSRIMIPWCLSSSVANIPVVKL